jgi:hypothetical protein
VNFIISTLSSFIGSLLAIGFWFHFDVDDHWRLWKARRGKRMEERARKRDTDMLQIHEVCLDEERARGCQL